jgi:hypothetical protein
MSLITQEARDNARDMLLETIKGEPCLCGLTQLQFEKMLRLVAVVASETVILTKNRINNL